MEEVINGILIREVETKNIMTKSSPVSYTHLDVYKRQPLNVLFGAFHLRALLASFTF